MVAFVVVLAQNLFGAAYSLFARKLAIKLPHAGVQVAAVMFTVGYLLVLPFSLLFGNVYVSDLIEWWPYLLLGGAAITFTGITTLFIFRYMDAAMGTLLATIYVIAAVAASMFVLGERMGLQELVGAALVLAAVVYALSVHVSRKERRSWGHGIVFALLGAFCYAVSVVTEKFLIGEMELGSYFVWGWGGQWVIAAVLSVALGLKHFKVVLRKPNMGLLMAASIARLGMGGLFVVSLVVLRSLCLAVILAGLRPLFVAFLGAWFLKERRFLFRKVVASIVAAVGVAVMFW